MTRKERQAFRRDQYDSFDGITAHVNQGLKGLNRLMRRRHKAGYKRGERLNQWVILGQWFTDSCGNMMKATKEFVPAEHFYCDPVIANDAFWGNYVGPYDYNRDAITSEEILSPGFNHSDPQYKDRPYHTSVSWGMGSDIPSTVDRCPVCGEGWCIHNCDDVWVVSKTEDIQLGKYAGMTIKDFERKILRHRKHHPFMTHDFRFIRNDKYIDLRQDPQLKSLKINERGWVGKEVLGERNSYIIQPGDETFIHYWVYYHRGCWKKQRFLNEEKYFLDVFQKAKMEVSSMTEIPNEYSNYDGYGPWYNVVFNVTGGKIQVKIGWRKRVINIEIISSPYPIDFTRLFKDEGVTKGSSYIHAWGTDKCVEYLAKIREYFDHDLGKLVSRLHKELQKLEG